MVLLTKPVVVLLQFLINLVIVLRKGLYSGFQMPDLLVPNQNLILLLGWFRWVDNFWDCHIVIPNKLVCYLFLLRASLLSHLLDLLPQ